MAWARKVRRVRPEGAQGTAGNQMALEVEGGGMHRNEALQAFEVWKQETFIRMAA
jgi:hypothetical protein